MIVVDRRHWRRHELFDARAEAGGTRWRVGSGAVFDLAGGTVCPANWTSADAAGLPIFSGLVRYDKVHDVGVIHRALRFTCAHTRRAFVAPTRHFASASNDPALPPMDLRVRLRADFDLTAYTPAASIIQKAGLLSYL